MEQSAIRRNGSKATAHMNPLANYGLCRRMRPTYLNYFKYLEVITDLKKHILGQLDLNKSSWIKFGKVLKQIESQTFCQFAVKINGIGSVASLQDTLSISA